MKRNIVWLVGGIIVSSIALVSIYNGFRIKYPGAETFPEDVKDFVLVAYITVPTIVMVLRHHFEGALPILREIIFAFLLVGGMFSIGKLWQLFF
jgi:hypothetical protein